MTVFSFHMILIYKNISPFLLYEGIDYRKIA